MRWINLRRKRTSRLPIRGTCPAIALSQSTLLMAVSKMEGLAEGATADLPRMGKSWFLCVLGASVVKILFVKTA